MQTVAITGCSGIIGQVLCQGLDKSKFRVIGVDLAQPFSQGGPAEINSSSVSRVCDLRDAKQCVGIFKGCDYVIHLAGQGKPDASFDDVLNTNATATYNVLTAAKEAGVKRVIFASTNHTQGLGFANGEFKFTRIENYGRSYGATAVTDPPEPDSLYACSKLFGEHMGYYFANIERSLEFVSLRIGWVFYDNATAQRGTPFDDFLRAMWLSRRDCLGYFTAALEAALPKPTADESNEGKIHNNFLVAYAVSNNSKRIYDLESTVATLGYVPQDSSDTHFGGQPPSSLVTSSRGRNKKNRIKKLVLALGLVASGVIGTLAFLKLTKKS